MKIKMICGGDGIDNNNSHNNNNVYCNAVDADYSFIERI